MITVIKYCSQLLMIPSRKNKNRLLQIPRRRMITDIARSTHRLKATARTVHLIHRLNLRMNLTIRMSLMTRVIRVVMSCRLNPNCLI
jgi:hypothetical protein